MMKKSLFLLLCLIGMTVAVNAQTLVRGVVLSAEDNSPLPGASVVAKGSTSIATVTDANGAFSLNVPAEYTTLSISFVGMTPQEVAVSPNVRVLLKNNAEELGEVVVVAYGQQRKEAITGAVANIKSDAIESRPIGVATAALEGQALGVQVNNGYGEPGKEPEIRIRGFNTINGSNTPLYVVNGVPMGGNVGDINSSDIESITVLKDASSAALYGNKAANGVILITTKGGRIGQESMSLQAKVNFGLYVRGIPEYDRMNAAEWMESYWMGRRNALFTEDQASTTPKYKDWNDVNQLVADNVKNGIGEKYNIFNKGWDQLYDANGRLSAGAEVLPGYRDDLDWYDELERLGNRQEFVVNASGGTNKSSYYMSVGYLDEQGFLIRSAGKRFTGNTRIEVKPSDWFKAGLTLNASHQLYDQMSGSPTENPDSYSNPFNTARGMAPIYPVHLHKENGEYVLVDGEKQYDIGDQGRQQSNARHIIWETKLDKDKTYRNTIDATAFADFILPYNITLTLRGNMNNRNTSNKTYNNAIVGDGKGQGRMKDIEYRYKNYLFQQLVNWNYTINRVHNVEAMVGHENFSYNYQYTYLYKLDEKFANLMELSNFATMSSMSGYQQGYRTEGYFSRVGYNYDDKYFAEFSFRRDGSSRFHKDNRWGNFWSLGGSWMISRENFMKDIQWIDFMKIRAAYGEVGQDSGISYYEWMALYSSTINGGNGAYYKYQNAAPFISWEKAKSTSVAVETRLLNRINLTLEYYDKTSKDLLFNVSLPTSIGMTDFNSSANGGTGRPTETRNFGSVSNRGLEIGIDLDVIRTKDWTWNVGTNLNTLSNKIKQLPDEYGKDGQVSGTKKYLDGHSIYDFWLYQFVGVDRSNGRSLYQLDNKVYYVEEIAQDAGGKTKVAAGNYTIIDGVAYSYKTTYAKKDWSGTSIPKLYGSFSTMLRYKNLQASVLLTFQTGAKMLDYSYMSLMGMGASPSAVHRDALKSWTPDQAGTGIDRDATPALNTSQTTDNNATSSRFLISSDYLNIKNVSVSYTFPSAVTDKLMVKGLLLSASIDNLHLFSARKGMNPQQSWNGINNDGYVTARTFSLGLNVKF